MTNRVISPFRIYLSAWFGGVSPFSIALVVVAVLPFARLTLRHVGESYFLADQVDQLQKYEAALRLDPEGLWGPAMSGTAARALGPFGAFVFGIPVSLGLGIDAIHAVTSLLLALSTGLALWQLVRINPVLGWSWFIAFTAMRMVWWNAAMFWVNTLLLPLGLVMLGLFAATLRRPSLAKVLAMGLMWFLALQVHLAALVAAPILVLATLHGRRVGPERSDHAGQPVDPVVPHRRSASAGDRTQRRRVAVVSLAIGVAILPYVLAEARTNLRNTRAMFSHVDSAVHSTTGEGRRAAFETLVLASDPLAFGTELASSAIIVGAAVAIAALMVLIWRRRRPRVAEPTADTMAMLWLVVTAVISIAGQALFFFVMARPLNGLHYAIVLAPWYPMAAAALLAGLVPNHRPGLTRTISVALAAFAIVLLVVRAPILADRFAERTSWNYTTIVTALDKLCDGQAVQTLEGPGLVDELTPSYDSVLQYLLKRQYTRCRYDENARVVIAANRAGRFDQTVEIDGHQFAREGTVLPPGLARYQRVN